MTKTAENKTALNQHTRLLICLVTAMAVWFVLFHSLTGGTLLQHSAYDSYSLLAENWLKGNLHLPNGENYTWLELAIYEGRYYISFPPVPALFMLPWVMLFGASVPSNLVAAVYGILSAVGVYRLFAKGGYSPVNCLWWSVLCVMGSNLCHITASGGVWFIAQSLNFTLVVWGLYFALGKTTTAKTVSALLLALAVGCRPFSIMFLALYMAVLLKQTAVKQGENKQLSLRFPDKSFWLPFVVAALVGLALAGYNYIRFGDIFEFGHNYLPEFTRREKGQFHLSYILPNLTGLFRPVTFTKGLDIEFPLFNGFMFFIANPVFLRWGIQLAKKIHRKEFTAFEFVTVGCFCLELVALCCHRTMGGFQFGARYLADLIPWVVIWRLYKADNEKPNEWQWLLCTLAVMFNIYGAIYITIV